MERHKKMALFAITTVSLFTSIISHGEEAAAIEKPDGSHTANVQIDKLDTPEQVVDEIKAASEAVTEAVSEAISPAVIQSPPELDIDKQAAKTSKPVVTRDLPEPTTTPIYKTIPLSDPSSAESVVDLMQLESHVNNKEYSQGYELAKKMLPVWEANSSFDFLYGVHAIETGHFDEATFAFERLTLLNPKTLRYRLELARALYYNNNLDTSKTEFEIALKANPPEKVKTNIQGFLDKITQTKEKAELTTGHYWAVGAGFNAGFDSNINSGTEEDGVDLPSVGFVSLEEEAQSQSSAFTQFTTQGLYSYSFKKHHNVNLSVNTSHKKNNETSTYDLGVVNAFAGYSWQPLRSLRLQGGFSNTNVTLDGDDYQNQSTISGMALYTRENGFSISSNVSLGERSAKTVTAPDADISLVSISVIWPSTQTNSSNVSLYTATDDVSNTELAHFGKDIFGFHYGSKSMVYSTVIRSFLLSVNSTEYQASDPNFQKTRKDTAIMGSWGYAWHPKEFMTVSANASLSHNASNLDLFTSYRAILNTGINFKF
jgi:tetratricopeptide (TPR) repeat protein